MRGKTRAFFAEAPLVAVLCILAMPLLYARQAGALYPPDGTKPDGAGGYMIPADGMCVIGIKLDGTMLVDWSITNARDCAAWTKSADSSVDLVSMNTLATCVNATDPVVAPNDGYRHAWSTSLCYDTVNNKGISRVDLDNTDAMCRAKGGTVVTTGKCVAYGWVYRNRESRCAGGANVGVQCTANSECPSSTCTAPGSTLPVTGTGLGTTHGVQSTDGLGFCYTPIRMPGTAATCPSRHNALATAPVGEWTAYGSPGCLSSTSGCQSQASYDAGLGWSFATPNCVYTYGTSGTLNTTITNAAGTTTASGLPVPVDLTTITNQGDCLAGGFLWDNWLPVTGTTIKTAADGGDYTIMPAGAALRKLDALGAVEDGGGAFYSGTGAVCEKCHSDQSRGYMERDKPGYVETRHKLAGDAIGEPFQPNFTAAGSAWGLQGVQCAMCHSTAKPPQDDLIQIVAAGVVGPPAAGAPKSASGHNQTEYGSHLLDICYTCHGTPATPPTNNPALAIPVSAGDFALTHNCVGGTNAGATCTSASVCPGGGCTGGLAPIANQFLNSPHAQYTGTSAKVDIGNKLNYGSPFEGYVCRTAAGNLNRSYSTAALCNAQAPDLLWYTTTNFGQFCYYTAAGCPSRNPGATWTTTYDTGAYPWAADTGGPGGVCYGIGVGSIATTVYRNGVAEKIPNLDSINNPACTNFSTDPTSGASGFWVRDGEQSLGGTPNLSDAGNCMTCHDVHWALASTDLEAEPIRRECTTCHVDPGTSSATGAPQIDLATINHLGGMGTPLEDVATEPTASCEICHMPRSSDTGSFMHLWRINTDSAYETMGATQANLVGDLAYVDIDHACGQCHGGGTVEDAQHQSRLSQCTAAGVPDACCTGLATGTCAQYRTKATLAAVAKGMHDSSGMNYAVTFGITPTGLSIDVLASVNCGGDCPTVCSGGANSGNACAVNSECPSGSCVPNLAYDWDWGDGQAHGSGQSASHAYLSGGTKSITLKVTTLFGGKLAGSATRSVALRTPDAVPVASATCTWDVGTWTISVLDTSTDPDPPAVVTPLMKVVVDWGDFSNSIGAPGGTFTHKYYSPDTYTVTLKAIDTALNASTFTCPAPLTPLSAFSIGGTVKAPGGSGLASARVTIKRGATIVKTVLTAPVTGAFTVGSLRPGTYKLSVRKYRYTFAVPGPTVTVGPSRFSNASCTGAGTPVECCTALGAGTCAAPIDITALTGP